MQNLPLTNSLYQGSSRGPNQSEKIGNLRDKQEFDDKSIVWLKHIGGKPRSLCSGTPGKKSVFKTFLNDKTLLKLGKIFLLQKKKKNPTS